MAIKLKNDLRKKWVKNTIGILFIVIITIIGIMGSDFILSRESVQHARRLEYNKKIDALERAITANKSDLKKEEFLYYIEIESPENDPLIYSNISSDEMEAYLEEKEGITPYFYENTHKINNNEYRGFVEEWNAPYLDLNSIRYLIRKAKKNDNLKATVVFYGFDDNYWESTFVSDLTLNDRSRNLINIFIIGLIVCLFLLMYLIWVCGYNENNEKITVKFDNIYFELRLLLLTIFPIGLLVFIEMHQSMIVAISDNLMSQSVTLIMSGTVVFLTASITLYTLLSLIRTLKHHEFKKKSFISKIFSSVGTVAKTMEENLQSGLNIFKGTDEKPITNFETGSNRNIEKMYRQLLLFVGLEMVVIFFFTILFFSRANAFLLLLTVIAAVIIAYQSLQKLKLQLAIIEVDIRAIATEQIKSERMKLDLITNVSHDLKTPLTSIISYSELLKEEKLPKAAKYYSEIIYGKANVLKSIVSDLFDLSKATSGDIELKLERIDYKKLIEQTIAEMQEQIESKQIKLVTQFPEYAAFIMGDGAKLHRALQNVIENALKYSIVSTRIFINLQIIDGQVNLRIINTANYEINFTGEEIVQRFIRGDEARTTEGSGLGLSISKSFVEICGGAFAVNINGDQFVVDITFGEATVSDKVIE